MQALASNPRFEQEIFDQIESLMKTIDFDTRSMKGASHGVTCHIMRVVWCS